jgi:acetyltransferase-like isoleucine patch superfamily enzyme
LNTNNISYLRTMNSFYNSDELALIGLKKYGKHILLSRKASIYFPEKITIGDNVRIDDFCILSGKIALGNHIHISAYSALYGIYGITMEDYTGLSPRCTVFSASDDFGGNYLISPMVSKKVTNVSGGEVTIKKFSQIGAGSIIMPNVIINEGVVIGAMSFVKKDVDEWGIYAGNPIRFIKHREKGLLKFYMKLKERV